MKNNNLYNDKELWDDGDLNWYDYGFRNYDPQVGRFTQLDPLTGMYSDLSPYNYAGNDPIGNVDEDGLSIADPLVGFAGHASKNLGTVVVKAVKHAAPVAAKSTGSIAKLVIKTFIQLSISVANDYVQNVKNNLSVIGNKVKESVKEGGENIKTNLTPGSPYLSKVGRMLYDPANPFGGMINTELAPISIDLKLLEETETLLKVEQDATKALSEMSKTATKNPRASKVMFGKYLKGGSASYNIRAGEEYSYFQLDNWDELLKSVGGNEDEMWNINKKFIDEQWKEGKEFFFSHDPSKATTFYKREIDYMKNVLHVREFKQVGENLWKAIR